jgi:hypothetical protein
MSRKTFIAGFALMAALAVLALAKSAQASGTFWFGFEQDLKPWIPGLDNAAKDYSFERVVGENGCNDLHGNAHATLKYVPTDESSAAWIAATFDGSGSDSVDVTFHAKNAGECATCKPVLYVGASAPVKGTQFVDPAAPPPPCCVMSPFAALGSPDKGIVTGWKTYHYSTGVQGANTIYLALGLRGAPTIFASKQTASIGIDCIAVDIKTNLAK